MGTEAVYIAWWINRTQLCHSALNIRVHRRSPYATFYLVKLAPVGITSAKISFEPRPGQDFSFCFHGYLGSSAIVQSLLWNECVPRAYSTVGNVRIGDVYADLISLAVSVGSALLEDVLAWDAVDVDIISIKVAAAIHTAAVITKRATNRACSRASYRS